MSEGFYRVLLEEVKRYFSDENHRAEFERWLDEQQTKRNEVRTGTL